MLRNRMPAVIIALLLTVFATHLHSQCLVAPAPDPCTGVEPTVSNLEIIPKGVKKWYYGATTTFSQVIIRGGTLVVCSDLTINDLQLDSGTVVIRPGAKLHLTGPGIILRGNAAFYNYGLLEVLTNVVLDNTWVSASKPNVIINATPTAVFLVSNNYFVINNLYSFFVNNGKSDFHGIVTDYGAAPGCVCMGQSSQISMTVINNNRKNTYVSPGGSSCVNIRLNSYLVDTLTNQPNVNMCLGPSHAPGSCGGCKPNAWGTPYINLLCSDCATITLLSVLVNDLAVIRQGRGYKLQWNTNIPAINTVFNIERSADAVHFMAIDSLPAQTSGLAHTGYDANPPAGQLYYRIRYVDAASGRTQVTDVVKVFNQTQQTVVQVSPNPFYNHLQVSWNGGKRPTAITIVNTSGRLVYQLAVHADNAGALTIPLSASLPAGSYVVKVVYPDEVVLKKIIKQPW